MRKDLRWRPFSTEFLRIALRNLLIFHFTRHNLFLTFMKVTLRESLLVTRTRRRFLLFKLLLKVFARHRVLGIKVEGIRKMRKRRDLLRNMHLSYGRNVSMGLDPVTTHTRSPIGNLNGSILKMILRKGTTIRITTKIEIKMKQMRKKITTKQVREKIRMKVMVKTGKLLVKYHRSRQVPPLMEALHSVALITMVTLPRVIRLTSYLKKLLSFFAFR